MLSFFTSSRRRFKEYLTDFKRRLKAGEIAVGGPPSGGGNVDRSPKKRLRGFWQLFAAFLRETRGHNRMLFFVLLGSSIATLLGLIPLYGTKIVFDHVLGDVPLPDGTNVNHLLVKDGWCYRKPARGVRRDPALFMMVRCEMAELRCETGARSTEDPIRTRAVRGGSEGRAR